MKITEIVEGRLSDIKRIDTRQQASEILQELEQKSEWLRGRLQAARFTRPQFKNPINIERNNKIFQTRKEVRNVIKQFNKNIDRMTIMLQRSKDKSLSDSYGPQYQATKINID